MIDTVADSNVLASGIAGAAVPTSVPGELVRRFLAGAFTLHLSEHVLGEVTRTLAKPYFRRRLSAEEISRAIAALRRLARSTPLTRTVTGVAPHPGDDLVLSTALSAGVPYLITGEIEFRRLGQFETVTLLTPREFLALLEASEAAGGS